MEHYYGNYEKECPAWQTSSGTRATMKGIVIDKILETGFKGDYFKRWLIKFFCYPLEWQIGILSQACIEIGWHKDIEEEFDYK